MKKVKTFWAKNWFYRVDGYDCLVLIRETITESNKSDLPFLHINEVCGFKVKSLK